MVALVGANNAPNDMSSEYDTINRMGILILLGLSTVYLALSIVGLIKAKKSSSRLYFIISGAVMLVQSVIFIIVTNAFYGFIIPLAGVSIASLLYFRGGIIRKGQA